MYNFRKKLAYYIFLFKCTNFNIFAAFLILEKQ
jgi:hypothetical protein